MGTDSPSSETGLLYALETRNFDLVSQLLTGIANVERGEPDIPERIDNVTDMLDRLPRAEVAENERRDIQQHSVRTLCRLIHVSEPPTLRDRSSLLLSYLITAFDLEVPQLSPTLWLMWLADRSTTEQALRDHGLSSSKSTVKIASVKELGKWVDAMNGRLAFRKFTPSVVRLLRDDEPHIRRAAFDLLVHFFAGAKQPAKDDLMEVMRRGQFGEQLCERLFTAIEGASCITGEDVASVTAASSSSPKTTPPAELSAEMVEAASKTPVVVTKNRQQRPATTPPAPVVAAASTIRPVTSLPQLKGEEGPVAAQKAQSHLAEPKQAAAASSALALECTADPLYPMQNLAPRMIGSDEEFMARISSSLSCFEGKETEQNWSIRQNAVQAFRAMLRSTTYRPSRNAIREGFKLLQRSFSEVLLSMRTTLVNDTCQAIKDTAQMMSQSPGFFELFDPLLESLTRVATGIKKITAAMANLTICALLIESPGLSQRQFNFICQESRNLKPHARAFAFSWLKAAIVTSRTVDLASRQLEIEKLVAKAVTDANPAGRTRGRDLFWTLEALWPEAAANVMQKLPASAMKPLQASRPKSTTTQIQQPPLQLLPPQKQQQQQQQQQPQQPQQQPSSLHSALAPTKISGHHTATGGNFTNVRPASANSRMQSPCLPRLHMSASGMQLRTATAESSKTDSPPHVLYSSRSFYGTPSRTASSGTHASFNANSRHSHRGSPPSSSSSAGSSRSPVAALRTSSPSSPLISSAGNLSVSRSSSSSSSGSNGGSSGSGVGNATDNAADDSLMHSIADLSMHDANEASPEQPNTNALDFDNLGDVLEESKTDAAGVLRQLASTDLPLPTLKFLLNVIKSSKPELSTSTAVGRIIQSDVAHASQKQREGYLRLLRLLDYDADSSSISNNERNTNSPRPSSENTSSTTIGAPLTNRSVARTPVRPGFEQRRADESSTFRRITNSTPIRSNVYVDGESGGEDDSLTSVASSASTASSNASPPTPKVSKRIVESDFIQPFPSTSFECKTFINSMIEQLKKGSSSSESLAALAVLVTAASSGVASHGSPISAAVTIWRQHVTYDMQLRESILPFLSQDKISVEQVVVGVVLLRTLLLSEVAHSPVYLDAIACLRVMSSIACKHSGLSLELDEHLLPEVTNLIIKINAGSLSVSALVDTFRETERAYSLATFTTNPANQTKLQPFYSQVLCLKAAKQATQQPSIALDDEACRSMVNLVKFSIDSNDVRVRKEVYPLLLTMHNREEALASAAAETLTRGQMQLFQYYLETLK